MSPIYVRPEREQAEHDRLIRFLQARYSQDFEALANPGEERVAPVKVAAATHFPDLVLNDDKRLAGVVEIETVASVNNLETMAKWVPFSRARVPFHLYVPVQGYEAAMRLAEAHQVKAAEIWTYRPAIEGFDLVRMFVDPSLQASRPAKTAGARVPAAKSTPTRGASGGAESARPATKVAAKPVPAPKPVKVGKPTGAAKTATAKASKAAAKTATAKSTGKGKPAKARPAAPRRAAPAKRPAKPVKARAARPTPKGGKKGAGARKGR